MPASLKSSSRASSAPALSSSSGKVSRSYSKIAMPSRSPPISSPLSATTFPRKEAALAEPHCQRPQSLPRPRSLRHAQILQRPPAARRRLARLRALPRRSLRFHQQAPQPHQAPLLRWHRPMARDKTFGKRPIQLARPQRAGTAPHQAPRRGVAAPHRWRGAARSRLQALV